MHSSRRRNGSVSSSSEAPHFQQVRPCAIALLAAEVQDHGHGFDIEQIPDPRDPDNLLKNNGRGILFMRSFMDVVEWSNHEGGGMVVKMIKRQ